MNEIEKRALEMLLAGENEALDVLRKQLKAAKVASRELTGVGFFTNLAVPPELPRLRNRQRLTMSDVYAEITGLPHDAGFVLFINDGAIECLECFIVDHRWPDEGVLKRAYYVGSDLLETKERDLEWALRDAF